MNNQHTGVVQKLRQGLGDYIVMAETDKQGRITVWVQHQYGHDLFEVQEETAVSDATFGVRLDYIDPAE